MPPIRTVTATKPLKTERTHEENQERAYIAASRRSDRSLEARVESARRASEIHKRRTGRSLRVTEQDVVNEEMYEEEDDNLPLQYRRLTAHLNTNSSDFNRRLAAYLTNHVAMRTALDQAIASSYAQQHPDAQPWSQGMPSGQPPMQQQWALNQNSMFTPNVLNPSPMPYQPQQNTMLPPPSMNPSPTSYRQNPYPLPSGQIYRPNVTLQRSATNGTPQEISGLSHNSATTQSPIEVTQQHDQQRTALSSQAPKAAVAAVRPSPPGPAWHRSISTSSLPQLKTQSEVPMQRTASVPPLSDAKTESTMFHGQQGAQPVGAPLQSQDRLAAQQMSFSPFSTTLPLETQTMLGARFDATDASGFNFAGSCEKMQMQQPFYSYNPNNFNKPRNVHPSYDGMSQTLAPGALDSPSDHCTWPTPPSATTDGVSTPFTPAYNYNFDLWGGSDMKNSFAMSPISPSDSGLATPADREWATFINPASWEETTT